MINQTSNTTHPETVHFDNGRGIKVTGQYLSTRYKDEALAPVQSVQVGRDPLIIASVLGLALVLFANRFGDLLFWHEQIVLTCTGLGILAIGYSIAVLRIGQYAHEKPVLISTIWTVNKVRRAIAKAKQSTPDNHSVVMIEGDGGE